MSALLSALKNAGIISRVGTPAPETFLEPILNNRLPDRKRMDMRGGGYTIHVSDLIKMQTPDRFCPRELVLSHFESRERVIKGISPGFQLLFQLGNAIHDLVRDKFMASGLGDTMWGNWICPCGKTEFHGCVRPNPKIVANVCERCGLPAIIYKEFSLYLHKYKLVGHPDLLIKWGSVFYLVEIKGIDRQDVVFDTLTAPLGEHNLQASFYYWMLKELGFNVSQKIIYVYVDRSTTKLWRGWPYKEIHHNRSKAERITPFLKKAEAVINGIETKTLPPRICTSDIATRAKNCSCAVSCFARKSSKITHSGTAESSASYRAGPISNVPRDGVIRPDYRAMGTLKAPPGKRQRADPQQFDLGGYRLIRREPPTPVRDVSVPRRLRLRSPPTAR